MRNLVAIVALVVFACSSGTPSLGTWQNDVWFPLIGVVPNPDAADAEVCEAALATLREAGGSVRPAPNPDLGDAAETWVRRAETLMFECSADAENLDYREGYDALRSVEAEVGALLATSP